MWILLLISRTSTENAENPILKSGNLEITLSGFASTDKSMQKKANFCSKLNTQHYAPSHGSKQCERL